MKALLKRGLIILCVILILAAFVPAFKTYNNKRVVALHHGVTVPIDISPHNLHYSMR